MRRVSVGERLVTGVIIATYIALVFYPILFNAYISVHAFTIGASPRPVLLENYATLFRDPLFWLSVRNTLFLWLGCLGVQLTLGIYLAFLLYTLRSKGVRISFTLFMLFPYVIPSVVVAVLWMRLLDPLVGPVPAFLSRIGVGSPGWFSDPQFILLTFILIDTWQYLPFVTLIVLGGMLSLDPNLKEAAEIDGASGWQILRFVILPLIAPNILSAGILRSVDLLRFFDTIYVTTQGGPLNSSLTVNIYAFRKGFEFFDLGYASALTTTLFLTILALATVSFRLRRRT